MPTPVASGHQVNVNALSLTPDKAVGFGPRPRPSSVINASCHRAVTPEQAPVSASVRCALAVGD